MQNSLGMGGGKTGAELAGDIESLVVRQTPDAAQQRREIFTIDIFHSEECVAIDFAHIVDTAHVGMRNAAGYADFIAEALQQAFIARRFIGKKLESDGLTERQIVGAVNLAHASFAEQSDDAITPSQQTAGKESAFIEQELGGTGWPRR